MKDDGDHGGHDRDEAAPAEEGQPVRQLDAVEAPPQQGGGDADDNAAQHAVVDRRLGGQVAHLHALVPGPHLGDLVRVRVQAVEALELLRLQGPGLAHDDGGHDPGHAPVDQVAEERRHAGGAVGLPGEADGDADGEDEREVVEDGAAGGGHDVGHGLHPGEVLGQALGAEHVLLAQADEQTGRRQRRDRQHERAPEPLGDGEGAARLLLV